MLKIYLKGFDRPYAVFGRKVFEDERFFVIESEGIQSRIPWGNILYIEAVVLSSVEEGREPSLANVKAAPDAPQPTAPAPASTKVPVATPPLDVESQVFLSQKMQEAIARAKSQPVIATMPTGENKDLNVVFTGYKQRTFAITVPGSVPTNEYSPQLSKEIFSNPQIKASLGDFVLSGRPQIDGNNVIIETSALQDKVGPLKDKLDITQKFLTKMVNASETKPQGPSLNLDASFAMIGSPFEKTVSLQDD